MRRTMGLVHNDVERFISLTVHVVNWVICRLLSSAAITKPDTAGFSLPSRAGHRHIEPQLGRGTATAGQGHSHSYIELTQLPSLVVV